MTFSLRQTVAHPNNRQNPNFISSRKEGFTEFIYNIISPKEPCAFGATAEKSICCKSILDTPRVSVILQRRGSRIAPGALIQATGSKSTDNRDIP